METVTLMSGIEDLFAAAVQPPPKAWSRRSRSISPGLGHRSSIAEYETNLRPTLTSDIEQP
eukprot:1970978-Prymnesium_polylepis.2